MVAILYYLLKVSISLALVFLFYQLVLRKLTFYNWNRWFLLGYSLLSFIIPFFNISPVLEKNDWSGSQVINWVPVVQSQSVAGIATKESSISFIDVAGLLLLSGMVLMFVRLLLQLLSFRKMVKKASCLSDQGMKLYEVNAPIIPFSFGNSIFINRELHTAAELQEIIRHEFVHIRQRHSIDILWTELLCLLNWFNPFAWMLKKAIRQNLEFIADQEVLEHGIPKKEYQYLLLKVTGNNQYSIATPFNFSSLKKRIAMMNKLQSARVHLVRFLFILPLLAVLLLAFRSQWDSEKKTETKEQKVYVAGLVVDAGTMKPLGNASIYVKEKNITAQTDSKGYYLLEIPFENRPRSFTMLVTKPGYGSLLQTENWGNFTEDHIYQRYSKSVEFFGLSPEGSKDLSFSNLVGNGNILKDISFETVYPLLKQINNAAGLPSSNLSINDTVPAPGSVNDLNEKGYQISITDTKGNCTVVVKDRNNKVVKRILLTEWSQKENYYEGLYGALPPPPPPPPPPGKAAIYEVVPDVSATPGKLVKGVVLEERRIPPAPPAPAIPVKLPDHVKSISIQNDKAEVKLKNGITETYLFSDPAQEKAFEKKYGKLPEPPPPPPAKTVKGTQIYEERQVEGPITEKRVEVRGMNLGNDLLSEHIIYMVDGKKTSLAEVNLIAPSVISKVNVIKDKQSLLSYGEAGKDGVVEITTKPTEEARINGIVTVKGLDLNRTDASLNNPGSGENVMIKTKEKEPLYILDGKEISKTEMQQKLANSIESVRVLKDKEATDLYGDKGKNGVVIVTSKKK